MKLNTLSFVKCVLLLTIIHCVSSHPSRFDNELPGAETYLKSYVRHHNINLLQNPVKHINNDISPSGYKLSGCENYKEAYKVHETKRTWRDAMYACYLEGAYLGFPRCEEEGRKYHRIIKSLNDGGAWIGISDAMEENNWVTVTDENLSKLDYVNWGPTEPNNYDGEEDCVEIYKHGKWYDTHCDKKLFYICKIDVSDQSVFV